MREEEFDKMITKQIQEQIRAPEELKNRIRTEIRQIENKPKRKRKICQGIAAVFTVAILGATTYAGITRNLTLEKMGLIKASENYDENALDINQTISNEYTDITLKSIACDNAYIIVEYQISLKQKVMEEFGEIEYDKRLGHKIYFNEDIEINQQETEIMTTYVNKTGEKEYQYFLIINIMDVKEKKLNLEMNLRSININDTAFDIESEKKSSISIDKKITLDIERNNTQIQKFEKIEKTIGNKTIFLEEVANTNFETFIKAKQITKNVTWKEYNENAMSYNSFMIEQPNGYNIPYSVRFNQEIVWVTKDGKQIKLSELVDKQMEDDEKITVEEEFTINMGRTQQEVNKVVITPTRTTFLNDRTDEEEKQYNKAEWHKLENKKYTATSSMGGTLEIENIEITDNKIIFYYNKTGNFGNEPLVIMRNNNGKYNYSYSAMEEEKGITGNENKIIFLRKDSMRVGGYGYNMTSEEFENLLEDTSNLEFTMLFGSITEKIGDAFEVEIPKLNKQTIKIKNIHITDLEQENYEEVEDVFDEITDEENHLKLSNTLTDEENHLKLSNTLTEDRTVQEDQISNIEVIERLHATSSTGAKMQKGETSINGIKLGMTREEVIKNIEEIEGNGIETEEMEENGREIVRESFGNNLTVEYAKENGQYYTYAIYATQENTQTDKGIKIGDSLEKVVAKYAKDKELESIKGEGCTTYALYGKEEIQSIEGHVVANENSECAYIQLGEEGYVYIEYLAKGETMSITLQDDKVINIQLVYDYYTKDGI